MSTEPRFPRMHSTVAENYVPDNTSVQTALKNILESKHFQGSKQCSELLHYIVEHSLDPEDAPLKERIIGIQVFRRNPTYDTAEDPVVRVRAADVRKRLAQYYQSYDQGSSPPLHIELLPGSYRATFRMDHSPAASMAMELPTLAAIPDPVKSIAPKHRSLLGWSMGAGAVLTVAALGLLFSLARIQRSPQELFWAPLTRSNQPILLYLGTNVAYIFRPEFLDRYRAAHGMINNGPEFVVDLPPDSSVHAGDLIATQDTFITTGDLTAVEQLLTFMDRSKRPFVLRSGRDIAFGDMRNRPAVLVGGFNNQWTLQVGNDLPFSLEKGTRIDDRIHNGRGWSAPQTRSSNTEDFAIIARLPQSKTGGPVVIVAGIGEYGTQAASEFVSSSEKMRELLRNAPPDWQDKNLEYVLHVRVVDFTPVGVDIVDSASW